MEKHVHARRYRRPQLQDRPAAIMQADAIADRPAGVRLADALNVAHGTVAPAAAVFFKYPAAEARRRVLLTRLPEPLLVQIEEAVEHAGPAERQMAIVQPQLLARPAIGNVVLQRQHDRRRQAGAVRAVPAVQEDRILAAVQHLQERPQLGRGRQMDRREADVLQSDAAPLRHPALVEIPRQRIAAAAQVDDGANAVRLYDPLQRGLGRLRAAVDLAGDDGVQVHAEQDIAEPPGAQADHERRQRGWSPALEACPATWRVDMEHDAVPGAYAGRLARHRDDMMPKTGSLGQTEMPVGWTSGTSQWTA